MDTGLTNEEMVIAIQDGKTDLIIPLWDKVYRLINILVEKRMLNYPPHIQELKEDAINECYFAFIKSIDTFDINKGMFTTHLGWQVRHTLDEFLSHYIWYRGKRDVLNKAENVSLDAKIMTGDDLTFSDLIADPAAEKEIEAIGQTGIREFVEDALSHVKNTAGHDVIRCMIDNDCTMTEACNHLYGEKTNKAIYGYNKALSEMRQYSTLKSIQEDREYWGLDIRYSGVSYKSFANRMFTSAVEQTVIHHETISDKLLYGY